MADRSGGSLAHTCFSSEVRVTSGAGSGVRAAGGSVGRGPIRRAPQAASAETRAACQGGEHGRRYLHEAECSPLITADFTHAPRIVARLLHSAAPVRVHRDAPASPRVS